VVPVSDTFVHDGADSDQVWYTIDDSGACVVLTVGGRIDCENCLGVCDAVLVASGFSPGMVVDMRRAEFAEAAAAGMFVRSLQRPHENLRAACVVGPPEPVGWLLAVSETAADTSVCASVPEAVASLSRDTRSPLPL
jgi:anti-anti-sigma regulatory factor